MYSPVPNCRGQGLIPAFGRKQHWAAVYYIRLLKGFNLKMHLPDRWVCRTPAPSKMGFFVTLVNGFFCQRAVSTIFGRLTRKSVETVRSQKKRLNNDKTNYILVIDRKLKIPGSSPAASYF